MVADGKVSGFTVVKNTKSFDINEYGADLPPRSRTGALAGGSLKDRQAIVEGTLDAARRGDEPPPSGAKKKPHQNTRKKCCTHRGAN